MTGIPGTASGKAIILDATGGFRASRSFLRRQGGCTKDADFDNDSDVDLGDFARFQGCFNGPNRPAAGCE